MKRVGLYSGTFDPVTFGHIDIIRRAFRLVDHLVVGIGINSSKQPLLSFEDRAALIKEETKSFGEEVGSTLEVTSFKGLVVDAADDVGAGIIIRGLRGSVDYEYEDQMVGMNGILNPRVETVFLTASPEVGFISSTLVRQIATMDGDISRFVPPAVAEKDLENTLYLDLKDGRVVIELLPDVAPKHVKRIKTLTREGFYDGIVFHRVIEGFMAQTGDPTGTGRGGSDYPDVRAEFSSEPFIRGAVGAARSQHPDSANSQFFIVFDDATFLDGNYTVWGRVTEGMEFVDNIKRGEPPVNPDKIVRLQVAADAAQ
eukprot:s1_g280.t1